MKEHEGYQSVIYAVYKNEGCFAIASLSKRIYRCYIGLPSNAV